MANKLKSLDEIIKIVENLKKDKQKIVTYNGSFDILHSGHISSIQEASKQGDVLIILLNSDESVKSYKGPTRPINNQDERAEKLVSLPDVDYIVIFNEINPKKILAYIKPDIHCVGADWGLNPVEKEVVERNRGKIYILKWKEGHSTSKLAMDEIQIEKAVFLDRDGTINDNKKGYIYKIEDFEFLPGVLESLKKLSKSNYKIIIVTNQSGIGRGYYTKEDFSLLNKWMINKLESENIKIDGIYFCPHVDSDNCDCRKPKIGMLLKAASELDLSLNKSWLVGDEDKDVVMGREANIKTIKIGDKVSEDLKLDPNFYAGNLKEAVEIILSN